MDQRQKEAFWLNTAAPPTQKSTNVRPNVQTKKVWKTHAQNVSSRENRDNKRPRKDINYSKHFKANFFPKCSNVHQELCEDSAMLHKGLGQEFCILKTILFWCAANQKFPFLGESYNLDRVESVSFDFG